MKKYIAVVFLISIIAVMLCSCGMKKEEAVSTTETIAESTTEYVTEPTTAPTEDEGLPMVTVTPEAEENATESTTAPTMAVRRISLSPRSPKTPRLCLQRMRTSCLWFPHDYRHLLPGGNGH